MTVPSSEAPVREEDRHAGPVVAGAAVIALITLVYAPGLGAGFVGDDFMILHRLRDLGAPGDALRFFRAEFFEYYRPLGFLSHALDWLLAGSDPRQYHLTNLLLHVANALLVLAVGWTLAPRSWAGPVAALLFGLHAAGHEPVMWISARFDLLATGFSLGALLLMLRGWTILPAAVFLLALLSKESAAALPLAAAAWGVFGLGLDRPRAARHVAPWLAALAVYAAARAMGGGVSAMGGGAKGPKLVALGVGIAAILWIAGGRWAPVTAWLRDRRGPVTSALAVMLILSGGVVVTGAPLHRLVAEKLAVAGFVISNLLTPVTIHAVAPFYLDPGQTWYWLGGLLLLAGILLAALPLWRRVLDDPRMLWLGGVFAATLLPITALTEGTRYLYLPAAALCLIAGLLVARTAARRRRALLAAVAVVVAISSVQVSIKVRDWVWAGRMTADGARLVDASLAPSCGDGHVVFLTSPVALRGVYTHFYYETFELPRGCQPAVFQVLARLVRSDPILDVRWDGPGRIVITAREGTAAFVLSRDLRAYDIRVRPGQDEIVDTPLGTVRADWHEGSPRLTLTLEKLDRRDVQFYYYSKGEIRRLLL